MDYAHIGPAFITWHRHFNIWFEYAQSLRRICNPSIPTGPIQRCPIPDRCRSNNPDWPTLERVNRALSFEIFDAAPWNELSSDGFRSFVDFEIGSDAEVCQNDRMCLCVGGDINCTSPEIAAGSPTITLTSRMHTTVSACLSLISYCAPIDLQFKKIRVNY